MSRSALRSGSGRAFPVWIVQRASTSFWLALAGCAGQISGAVFPALIACFSSRVLRCLGAATRVLSPSASAVTRRRRPEAPEARACPPRRRPRTGLFLGAYTARIQPVTGDATLTADLADLSSLDLAVSDLQGSYNGLEYPLPDAGYTLDRNGNRWADAGGRVNAQFYGRGTDPAAAAAGTVTDLDRSLIGAWGARR